jgi:hypothetical protein
MERRRSSPETDQKTLTPILAVVTTAGGFHRVLKFESGHVHSVMTAPSKQGEIAKTRESDIAIAQPVFDFDGGTFGLLIAGFPLRENFSAKLSPGSRRPAKGSSRSST